MYQDADTTLKDDQPPEPFFDLIEAEIPNQDGYSSELQHLFRSGFLNLTTGGGYFDINGDLKTTLVTIPAIGLTLKSKESVDINHWNAYSYGNINILKNLTATVGASTSRCANTLRPPQNSITSLIIC